MHQFGDTIGWPTRDPEWIRKVILMGLITLIPVVGAIAVLGWMLAALDNLRAGRQELPPAGFAQLGRGVNLFLVLLVYGLGLGAVLVFLFGAGAALAAVGSQGAGSAGLEAFGALFLGLGWLGAIAGQLLLFALLPAIILQTERGGIGAGLRIGEVAGLARRHAALTLTAGLMSLLAYVLGGLGAFICGIGYFLTIAYGYAMMAGVVRVYELQAGFGPQLMPYPPSFRQPPPPAAPA